MNCSKSFEKKLKVKTRAKGSWNSYQVIVKDGLIKLHKGKVLRGDYDLAGSSLELSKDASLTFKLLLANPQKTVLQFSGTTETEIQELIAALNCGIYHKNVEALTNGFRTPQVIDWYFQHQAEFREYESLLRIKHQFQMEEGPLQGSQSLPLVVYLSINPTLTGLAIEIERTVTTSEGTEPYYELIQTIPFRDMTSITQEIPSSPSPPAPSESLQPIALTLRITASPRDHLPRTVSSPVYSPPLMPVLTAQCSYSFACFPSPFPHQDQPGEEENPPETPPEKQLIVDLDEVSSQSSQDIDIPISVTGTGDGIYFNKWFQGLIFSQSFLIIPSPVHSLLSPMSLPGGNNKTSNGQYVCSSDVIILMRSLESYYSQVPSLEIFVSEISKVFKLLSTVKCNRDAACCFGSHCEEIIRVLANPRQGLIRLAGLSSYSLLQSHLQALYSQLSLISQHLSSLSSSRWLSVTLYGDASRTRQRFSFKTFRTSAQSNMSENRPYLRIKYEEFDSTLMTLTNRLLRDFPRSGWTELDTVYSYDMILDVTETIESYGGIKKIKSDQSKIRALSRLLQSNENELEIELKKMSETIQSRLCNRFYSCLCCCCVESSVINSTETDNPYDRKTSRDKAIHRKSQSKRPTAGDLAEELISDTSSYGAKAGDTDFFQPSLREEQQQQQLSRQQQIEK